MELSISVHNFDLTPRLQQYVERKTARLDRYLPNLVGMQVELTSQSSRSAGDRQIAQVTLWDTRGTILRAEERGNDIFAAIDSVVDKLYRQIKRYRGKHLRNRRIGAEEAIGVEPLSAEVEADFEDEEDSAPTIVRRKTFALRPMLPDEALEQMELLGHDFFVFYSAEDEAINVIYRRRDGNYGLLQPMFD